MCDVRTREEGEGSKSNLLLVFLADSSALALASPLESRSTDMVQLEEQSALGNDGKEEPRRRGPLKKVKGERSLREEGASSRRAVDRAREEEGRNERSTP